MSRGINYFDASVGTFVLLCAAFFFVNSFQSAKIKKSGGYHVTAKFDNIDGVKSGSDVRIAGVKVGVVDAQSLSAKSYRAELVMSLDSSVKLPSDSSVKVASEGLLGSKYLAIEPGAEEEFLKDGDEILFTQSSINFEDLLGKFIFSSNEKKKW